jgi:hypothetical protein
LHYSARILAVALDEVLQAERLARHGRSGRAADRPAPSPTGTTRPAHADALPALSPLDSPGFLPVLHQITENSAILAEIFARLPHRTHRHDDAGRLRPVLFAPKRNLELIAKQTYARDHAQFRPGAQVSPAVLDLPVASRRGDQLRALTPDAVAYLRASGVDLARAASDAEQALELAAGVGPRSSAPRPGTHLRPTQHPAPPHMPRHLPPGASPNTGMPR